VDGIFFGRSILVLLGQQECDVVLADRNFSILRIDLSDLRLLFNVLGMVAEFGSHLIRMRTREGMGVAKAKGG
jgi:DNA invertase Pin-like site-specific DNA recombinase